MMAITIKEVHSRLAVVCHEMSNDLCSGLDRIAQIRLSYLYNLIYPLYLDTKESEESMKDKDQQSEEFENKQALTGLWHLRADINASVDHARAIADTHIQRGKGGRELSLAITNLQQARMWTKEALAELGQEG